MATRDATAGVQETKPSTSTPFDVAAVFGASVQLPNFDKVEPETWFTVADANFALRKATDTTTKYYYVLSKLDAPMLRQLSAFLKVPRGSDPYGEIRAELCDAYEAPLDQKLDALLALSDLGDERPKTFGKELQRFASDASREDILKRIFVRCLPQCIVTAITGSLGGKLDAVITAADKAWTASAAQTHAPVTVSAISGPPQRGGKRGGRQRGGIRSSGTQITSMNLCVFHKKFGQRSAHQVAPGVRKTALAMPSQPGFSRSRKPSRAKTQESESSSRKTARSVAERGRIYKHRHRSSPSTVGSDCQHQFEEGLPARYWLAGVTLASITVHAKDHIRDSASGSERHPDTFVW